MEAFEGIIADRDFIEAGGLLPGLTDDCPGGIIMPVDKPYRWTSADVIRKLKWAAIHHFGKRNLKLGHAGTLDPLATGVLLVCIGGATKLAETLQRETKEYVAGLSFGATTPSYDLEKDIDCRYPVEGVSAETLEAALPSFLGEQQQIAPLFSAKSVDGVRAYEIARKAMKQAIREGKPFDHSSVEGLTRQEITIYEMELMRFSPAGIPESEKARGIQYSSGKENPRINVTDNSSLMLPHAQMRIVCSKGTYIRALARDLGEALGSGAHLDSLRRTRSGIFTADKSLSIDQAMALLG